jgi:hypothetical protein
VQAVAGQGQAAFVGDGLEDAQQVQVHVVEGGHSSLRMGSRGPGPMSQIRKAAITIHAAYVKNILHQFDLF